MASAQQNQIVLFVPRAKSAVNAAWQKVGRAIVSPVIFIAAAVFMPMPAFAVQSVTLAWAPSPDLNVVGYNVYYGTASGNYTWKTSSGNVGSATISNLVEGVTYYFVVTAYDVTGLESVPSNEVSYTVPGVALSLGKLSGSGFPNAFSISSAGAAPSPWALEASQDLKTWVALMIGTNSPASVAVVVSTAPSMFFRLNSGDSGVRLSLQKIQRNGFPNSFCVTSTGTISSQWALQTSADLKIWSTLTSGTNSPVNALVIASTAPSMFFRLKSQ